MSYFRRERKRESATARRGSSPTVREGVEPWLRSALAYARATDPTRDSLSRLQHDGGPVSFVMHLWTRSLEYLHPLSTFHEGRSRMMRMSFPGLVTLLFA